MAGSSRLGTTAVVSCLCVLIVVMASPATVVFTTAHTQPQPHPHPHPHPHLQPQQSQAEIELNGEVDVATSDLPGDGSESNPYKISNISELQAMEDDLDSNYTLVSDINASATAQFNNGSGFNPIGSGNTPFSGSFDGTNNTITGLTIDRPDESNVGVFGVTGSGATLADVTLANVTVTGDNSVGGLVGVNNRGAIRTAKISGNVTGERIVGGVVGINDNGRLRTTRASGGVTGIKTVGGLVGDNAGPIQNARASGTVSGASEVGGLVGSNGQISFPPDPTIRHAFAIGSVTGDRKVGGVVGDNFGTGTVEQSYFDRQATDQSTSAGNATGLTTAQMQGSTAAENMNLGFGETWQTVSGDYPELIALTDSDSDSPETDTSLPTIRATIDDSGELGGTARVSYTLRNVSDQSSVELNLNLTDSRLSVNESLSEFDGGETEANGQQIRYPQPSQAVTPTIGYDIPESFAVPAVVGFELTLPVTVEVLTENSTVTDTATVRITPGLEINRTISAKEVSPGEEVTVATEISGVSGSVATTSGYDPQVTSATVPFPSVTVNGVALTPREFIAEATVNGSTVTLGGIGDDATVTITEELTVSEELNVTHQITGSVRTIPSRNRTSVEIDPLEVTVTENDTTTVRGVEVPTEFTSETPSGDPTVTADNAVEAINTFIAGEISADVTVDVINAFIAS
jgi:hypothetical protein